MKTNLTVVLLAGGRGARMQSTTPKQYMAIKDKRVVDYSLDVFCNLVDEVIVVIPNSKDVKFYEGKDVKCVVGGSTRTESVVNGLKHVKTSKVLIHDASRPFVSEDIVRTIADKLDSFSCVYPVLPVGSSLVVDNNGFLLKTPNRAHYMEVQTPQGFHKEDLLNAIETIGDRHTHLPELIRLRGGKVKHIQGTPWLFKITYKPSIYAAHGYLEELLEQNQDPC